MKKEKGLNSKKKRFFDYDGWHITVIGEDVVEVIPNGESRIELLTKVLFCERYAKQRQCYLQFRMFLSRKLGRLESILKVHGYSQNQNQNQILMCRDNMDLAMVRRSDVSIKIYDKKHKEFMERRQKLLSEKIPYGQKECICELVVNNFVIGSGFATVKSEHMGIFNIYIKEEYRGCGYGEQLLRAIFYWGREACAKTAYLNVNGKNECAIYLYKKLGFKYESEICIYEKIV